MNKQIVFACALAGALTCVAEFGVQDQSVTVNGVAHQIKIEYTLKDVPAIVTIDVKTNGVSIGTSNITHLSGDVNRLVDKTRQRCTAYWQADKSWPGHVVSDGSVTFEVVAWATNRPPDYCTVNLKNGDIRYYNAEDQLPDGAADAKYKSDYLVLRYIAAAGVPWYMGSYDERGRQSDRETYQQITLTNDYYMGIYEFTQAQWSKFIDICWMTNDLPVNGSTTTDGKLTHYVGDCNPVSHFKFEHLRESSNGTANAACAWPAAPSGDSVMGRLRSLVGDKLLFDLPSEAQWEFACRSGTTEGHWNDGSKILGDEGADANLDQLAYYNTGMYGTAEVGSKNPNLWGLYDMHGNVREMCLDYYKGEYRYPDEHGDVCLDATFRPNSKQDYPGHVLRGGQSDVGRCKYLRSAARSWVLTNSSSEGDYRDKQNGFRVIAVMP